MSWFLLEEEVKVKSGACSVRESWAFPSQEEGLHFKEVEGGSFVELELLTWAIVREWLGILPKGKASTIPGWWRI